MLELERYDPALGGRIKYEHYHRYAFACEQITGLDVLDIASGEGYGSAMLAATAARVTGVDIDAQAVSAANLRYGRKDRLSYAVGQAQAIPFPDASFDAVTSFETIEHIPDPVALVREIKRVLKPGGFAMISTPNKSVYNQGLAEPNAFHVREMEMAEFVLLLEETFKSVAVYGQRMVIASAISPVGRQEDGRNSADYRGYTVTETNEGSPLASPAITRLTPPEYVVCIVGDDALPHPAGADSMFLMREHDLWAEHAKVMRWASGLHDEDQALRAALEHAVEKARDLDAAHAQIAAMSDLRRVHEQEIARLGAGVQSGSDLSTLGPLLEEIAGGPIEPSLPMLIRLLNRISVERATQEVRLNEYLELKTSSKAAAIELEDARRKLRDAEDLTRKQGELVDGLNASLAERQAASERDEANLAELGHAHEKALAGAASLADEVAAASRSYGELQSILERELERRGKAEAALAEQSEQSATELRKAKEDAAAAVQSLNNLTAENASLQDAWRGSEESVRQARAALEERENAQAALAAELERARENLEIANGRLADQKAAMASLTEALEVEQAAEHRSLQDAWRGSEESLRQARAALEDHKTAQAALTAELASERENLEIANGRLADQAIAIASLTEAREAEQAKARARSRGVGDRPVGERETPSVQGTRLTPSSEPGSAGDAGSLHQLQNASFSAALRARRGDAALDSVRSYRLAQEALGAIRPKRAAIHEQLRQASGLALIGTTAPKIPAVAIPAAAPSARGPKSVKGRALALLKGTSSPERRRDSRLSDALLMTLFDSEYYVRVNKLSLSLTQSALDHYFAEGRALGLSTHPLIDRDWLKQTRPANVDRRFDLVEYMVDPELYGFSPHPLFDAEHYLLSNPDVLSAGANPLAHYLLYGWREGRGPNPLFDSAWYLTQNADVRQSGLNALAHYAQYGGAEGRQPHPLFDRGYYLSRYPDVAASGMEAFTHYIAYGRQEGRKPGPLVDDVERYVSMFDSADAVDLLLGDEPFERLKPIGEFWPPAWDGEYWLPQKLRDLVIDRYGMDKLDLYIYLFSVIDRYAENPEAFTASDDCARLVKRARLLSSHLPDFRPTVSIVVPVYNNLLYTLTCIVSVLEIEHKYSFEIIVGDDLSSDGTKEAIEAIGGIVRLNRNASNLGFLQNCNAAADVAKGEHLVMLNNDVIVLPGWLDNLIEPLVGDAGIGFVGSKLINGDGTLQEAGGIFWQDGSAWNYGRNSDPSLPEFNYLKDADYVSGASIAIPRAVWFEMQGFDPIFTPAYCEDSDLAFRIRAAGYRTVYHPHSVLVHHEGRSHGRDTGSGIKAYQVINGRKFLQRWNDTLSRDHFPNGEQPFLARDRSRNKPHILVIDHYVPQWDRDAGSRTVYQYIRMFLERGFAVTFWPENLHEDREYTAPLQAMGVEVIYHPAYVGRFPAWMAENGRYFDHALICRPHVADKFIDDIRIHDHINIIYYGVDLHCKRLEASYELTGDIALLEEAARWEVIERRICAKCDVVLYPGFHEVEVVRTWVPDDVAVLNFPITIFSDLELQDGLANLAQAAERDPYGLMFVGGFTHHPNVGGVKWFVEEVLPRLRRVDPRFNIRIAGSNAPPEISRLAGAGVTMLGRVSDDELMEMYRTSAFSIVPLLYGAGVKGKVIEAMARGVPVAMTSVGAQGIEDARDLAIVEDDAAKMANAIIAAAANRTEAIRKAGAAVEFIRRWYSEVAVEALLLPHIPELAPRS